MTWVSSTGIVWTDTGGRTVDTLQKWAEGPDGDEVTQDLRDLVFVGPQTVRALDRQTGEADPELSARQRNALVTLLSELDQSRGSRLLELFNVGLKRLSAKASHRIVN